MLTPRDLRLSADSSIFPNGRKKKAETQGSGLTPEEHVVVVTDRKYGIVLPTCGALVGRLLGPVATVQRLRRNPLLLDEQVNQGLHGLHLLVRDQLIILGDGDKVHKAHVQDVVLVDVPEGVQPVSVVQMRVAAEHLLHDTLAVLVEGLWEPTGLSNPLIWVTIRSKRGGGICRGSGRSSDGSGVLDGGGFRNAGDLLGGEHNGVMYLADDPLLDTVDEFGRGDLSCAAIDKPSVGQPR